MNRRIALSISFIGLMLMACCCGGAGSDNSIRVAREELGDKWPFTVNEVVLTRGELGALLLTAEGKTYALNGTARGQNKYLELDTTRVIRAATHIERVVDSRASSLTYSNDLTTIRARTFRGPDHGQTRAVVTLPHQMTLIAKDCG